jgi:addiction module HigA family antidote
MPSDGRHSMPTAPGKILRQECINRLGLTVTEVAEALGVTRKALTSLLSGEAAMSPEMAIRLEMAGWGSAEGWLAVQTAQDIRRARERLTKAKVAALPNPEISDQRGPSNSKNVSAPVRADLFDDLLDMVDQRLMARSGAVFYSSRAAFTQRSAIYLLGLNPGGDPDSPQCECIEDHIAQARHQSPDWSAYKDEVWRKDYQPGGTPMQWRVCHLVSGLGFDIRSVPASNVVFVRSKRETDLRSEKRTLLEQCWPVHQKAIEELGVRLVLCFGGTAGEWVRQRLKANTFVAQFKEVNGRGWTSWAHKCVQGDHTVVTLTHPSIVDWTKPGTDPTSFVFDLLKDQKHDAA